MKFITDEPGGYFYYDWESETPNSHLTENDENKLKLDKLREHFKIDFPYLPKEDAQLIYKQLYSDCVIEENQKLEIIKKDYPKYFPKPKEDYGLSCKSLYYTYLTRDNEKDRNKINKRNSFNARDSLIYNTDIIFTITNPKNNNDTIAHISIALPKDEKERLKIKSIIIYQSLNDPDKEVLYSYIVEHIKIIADIFGRDEIFLSINKKDENIIVRAIYGRNEVTKNPENAKIKPPKKLENSSIF